MNLLGDVVVGLFFLFLDFFQEFFLVEVVVVYVLGVELVFDYYLGGDVGVIGVWLLQGVVVLYVVVVDQCVYDCVVEVMVYVQVVGYVWWWDYDGVGLVFVVWSEVVVGFLGFVLGSFDGVWLVSFVYVKGD